MDILDRRSGVHTPDRKRMELAVRSLLNELGYDSQSPDLLETPRRVAKALVEMCTPEPFLFTTFSAAGVSEMVVQAPIPFHSLCEHHMLPFSGVAAVAYIPGTKLVGLSKLSRAVRHCAAGLNTQERITGAIAEMLRLNLDPVGVGVVLRARHSCMEVRGVCAPGVYTTSSALVGAFRNDAKARDEFMSLAMETLR